MPGQRRAVRDHVSVGRRRRARGAAGLAVLAVLAAAGTAAFVFLARGSSPSHPRPLATTLASQQLAGLAVPGPGAGSPQRLLTRAGSALAFFAGGGASGVLANQQWQADTMTDGSYVLVYVPDGMCLNAGSAGSASPHSAGLSLKRCDLSVAQRWSHPYLGKDPSARDYWQLRSQADGLCLSAAGSQWADGTPAQLQPCGKALPWQQLVQFLSAY